MKKHIFVSGITLMTMLLAVGCSNTKSQGHTNNDVKSSKTSHKKSHKSKKHNDKELDSESSDNTSDKKEDKSSKEKSDSNKSDQTGSNADSSSNSNNTTSSNTNSNTASTNSHNNSGQSAANNVSDSLFNKMVSNTVKEHGYASNYGPENFTLIEGGNGQYSLAEKSTGTIVGHYSVKNGDLYKQDIVTGNDVKVK